ncbi:MAG: hypothetical protein WCA12_19935 [Burkholderiales bacterium]
MRACPLYLACDDVDPRKLAGHFVLIGALMAAVNAAVALSFSKDTGVLYSLWRDLLIAVVLSAAWAIQRSRGALPPASSP